MESVGPLAGAIISMNNYFHDVATGLVIASVLTAWFLMERAPENPSRQRAAFILDAYGVLGAIAKYSLCWVLLAGVPRTIYFKRLEWAAVAGELQVPAIIIKHIVVLAFVIAGIYYWRRFRRKARLMREKLGPALTR